jgi:hypothetical protein
MVVPAGTSMEILQGHCVQAAFRMTVFGMLQRLVVAKNTLK